jgi:thymidine phosphorylase
VRLGAGRQVKEDDVDPGVGITIHAKVGDPVDAGDALGTVRYNTDDQLGACLQVLETAWVVSEEPQPSRPLILLEVR